MQCLWRLNDGLRRRLGLFRARVSTQGGFVAVVFPPGEAEENHDPADVVEDDGQMSAPVGKVEARKPTEKMAISTETTAIPVVREPILKSRGR